MSEAKDPRAQTIASYAERAHASFNQRFWSPEREYLYDVIDGPEGDDAAFRPNQILSFALRYPVLESAFWPRVLEAVKLRLLTPVGLRTLSRDHPDYKAKYFGDLRSRDAAYHQGTVWPWLLGPFINAMLRVHPEDRQSARNILKSFGEHAGEACESAPLARSSMAIRPSLPEAVSPRRGASRKFFAAGCSRNPISDKHGNR